MKVWKPTRLLTVLVAVLALIVVGAAPASAATGYWYVKNSAGGCLDHSVQFGWRVFSGCNGDFRYQWQYFQHTTGDPDVYRIIGNSGSANFNSCLTAYGNGRQAVGYSCVTSPQQYWAVRYAGDRPYFDSVAYPGLCLTRSNDDSYGGFLLTTEPCAGRESQYWQWLGNR
ncbi:MULTISPECIES: ricin-type beta-trefoil lectin domain protein [Catenuloplanes]|uniref:Ricin B lectin domain-containing protein n=1 Tax=Catenuloplanes niger TaxID=587534 RepID=A0AAE3ZMA4_9ACTN|nr:ricin-type beta-trefoil lectin domain protein [Catenuloplanes niger]MDR7320753.1 hypothetical protein [Catenuloplanes niger]